MMELEFDTKDQWFELSAAQHGRWFVYRYAPVERGSHNNVFVAALHGPLDAGALAGALNTLAARHPMLRAVVREGDDGEPVQRTLARADVPFEIADVAGLDDAALRARVEADAWRAFDLDGTPLVRAHLYRRGENEAVFVLAFDHLVCDGWSYWRLLDELRAVLTGGTLAEVGEASYRGYVAWQRDWLVGPKAARQLDYWKNELGGDLVPAPLPADRQRGRNASGAQGAVTRTLPVALAQRLAALSSRAGGTLYTTLLAALQILVRRYTGRAAVAIGSPMPGRSRRELDGVVGDFVNVVALRGNFDTSTTVIDALRSARGAVMRALRNQDYPFAQLVDRLRPAHGGEHPFFQTAFVFQKARGSEALAELWNPARIGTAVAHWGNVELRPFPMQQKVANDRIGLGVHAIEFDDGVRCDFTYDADLFDASTVARIAACYETLLAGMADDESACVDNLPLLPADERERVLTSFNATALAYRADATLHGLFEEQVRRNPSAVALVHDGVAVGYAELNRRANRIAHRLIACGVRPDDRVAICAQRGMNLVAAMLGVLKAGGAYVPVDPNYPADRIAYMLADSAPRAVLVDGDVAAPALPATTACIALDDTLASDAGDADPDAAVLGVTSRHLAYVIYTSGSTGRPKGVAIEHTNAVNLVAWGEQNFSGDELANTLCATSISFDLAVYELFVPLCTGRTVTLVRDVLAADAATPVTLVNTVPSGINALLDAARVPATARLINLAGEPLKARTVERIFATTNADAVANLYGPTETTTYSTWVRIARGEAFPPHIGKPVANTRVYILDAQRQLLPAGAIGEIHIGGAGVARGYLGRPELTAERFLDDPFAAAPNARMYRTGDLGRWLPDGSIEYLGRNDFQVKIRGFRIEPGEIEARLAAFDGVREAVVVAMAGEAGDKRLVAYVVAHPGANPVASDLRDALSRDLAEHMIPSAFVMLAAMPLTPNGKLDRAALPAPDLAVAGEYVAPRTPTEVRLAAIWSRVLGVEAVGRDANFFELGGHSLLAMRLAGAIARAFGKDLPLRDLFEHGTLARLAAHLDAQPRVAPAAIPLASRDGALPLSFAQRRLWFIDQLDAAAGAAYHMPAALRLTGPLDRAALQAALDRVVARHENLRANVIAVDGEPVLTIAPPHVGCTLAVHDLRTLDDGAQARRVAEWREREARAPFDLAADRLLRGRLLVLADDAHVLLVTQHHIVSDGWSIGVLVDEIGALYAAFREGAVDPLPPLAIQYADYAAWQSQRFDDAASRAALAHWRTHLDGAPAVLELPTDHARPAAPTWRAGAVAVSLSAALTARLRAASQRRGATLFMTLLASWAALLSRLSGQDDVVVGTPVANRRQAEVEPLIGLFVNTLALRVRTASADVAALLGQVKAATLDGYAHQELPFDQVVDALNPPRHLGRSPVFQSMFTLDAAPLDDALTLAGIAITPLDGTPVSTSFDLSLSLADRGDVVTGRLEFARDLFDAATIERWAGHWLCLVEAMLDNDAQAVSRLPLLRDDERVQLIAHFNPGAYAQDGGGELLHGFVEAHAASRPDALAVVADDESLTYAELDQRANRAAHALIALGVRPDDRVALCIERGAALIVGIVAILKAGGAYVPLDPAYPAERLAAMLADCAPAAFVTTLEVSSAVPLPAALPVLRLDALPVSGASHVPRVAGLTPRHLAYVIYTSGSTGRPKGVMVEHASVAIHVRAHAAACAFAPGYRVLQFASFAFDSSVEEIFPALAAGATLVVRPAALTAPDDDFIDFLAAHRIDHADLPTAFWHAWADAVGEGRCLAPPALRRVVIGGEKLDRRRLDGWFSHVAACPVQNTYGPTEATVYATSIAYTHATLPIRDSSIGRPLPTSPVYVLDANGAPVPIGVAGELHIGGVQVARGYLGREALTADRFVADPFAPAELHDARLYKTGDIGRWLPDGTLEYLGRNDEQVKIRGFRVEPGEIAALLAACVGVRDALVVARGNEDDLRLVAYVTPAGDAAAAAAALRAALARELPEYMLPAAFVSLDAFPLTPNGKIDRRALPAPEFTPAQFIAPQTDTEIALAAIWSRVLKQASIGRDANFFELGGHSLLATRVASEIAKAFGKPLPVRALFEHTTVERLAAHLDAQAATGYVAIPRASRDGDLPLSFAQQRLWFIDRLDGGSAQYNMAAALRLRGALDVDALQRALDALVARHDVLRTTFVEVGGVAVQRIAAQRTVAITHDDLRGTTPQALQHCIDEEAARPFDLANDAMLRCRLARLADDDYALLFTQHHIASDGWSIGVLVEEFAALYRTFANGEVPSLPTLAIQYADYAAWQRARLQGESLRCELAHWSGALSGLPVVHNLPLDRPRPAQQSFDGARIERVLDAATLAGLQSLAREHDASLFMVLEAAFAALLSRWSGETDIAIGTPIAGRLHKDVEPLIGFFVNTLVLRSDLAGDPDFVTLLAQTKATALAAYAHQEIPFEMLVEEIKPARSLAHTPLFQVLLSLETDAAPITLDGLDVTPIAPSRESAKFDLELAATVVDDGLRLSWLYATALFDAATAARLAEAFERLLRGVIASPLARVGALPLIDDADRVRLAHWNDTARPFERDIGIHEVVELQVAATPDAVAVRCGGQAMSYADLDARANRIAHRLRAAGVRRGALVGLALDRDADMLAALLGVLKAGAGYVPLDPRFPADRLAFMADDAGLALLVTQSHHAEAFAACACERLVLDTDDMLDAMPATRIGRDDGSASAGDVAYVIYTSGSTGRPKGVAVPHRAAINFFAAMGEAPGMTARDRVVAVTTLSFDIALLELMLPLCVGAQVVLADAATAGDGAALAALVDTSGATLLQATPATWRLLLAAGWRGHDTFKILCGGEALSPELAARLLPCCGQLWNMYGPTETTVWSTCARIERALPVDVHVGRPIANTRVHVLDAHGNAAPVGVAGEIVIAGEGVALGYHGRPGLTAERFVPDVGVSHAGARMYRTGDLGRWRADGMLEHLGRTDAQVKVRGFRIEPGEIEARLLARSGVREAVVVARADGHGDARLVAYLVMQDDADPAPGDLRRALARDLADYMIPAAFVRLAALPLTPNGKVDRNRLPDPDGASVDAAGYVAPRDGTETQVADVWRAMIGLDRAGADDDFFRLGGHSLLAIRVVGEIAARLGRDVAVRAIFEHSTVRALAAHIDAQAVTSYAAIPRTSRDGDLPLSFAQQRLWFIDRLDGGSAQYNMPAALRLHGRIDVAALRRALDALVARHDVLRTVYAAAGDAAVQVVRPHAPVAIAHEDLRGTPDIATELARRIDDEAALPFDLSRDTLLRCRLIRLDRDEHALLLTQHHIASDGWSIGVLVEEFAALYRAFANGEAPSLPALAIQYADYAAWQRARLQGESLRRELDHWRGALGGLPVVHNLPLDRARPAQQSFDGARIERMLDAATLAGLQSLAREHDASLFMVLDAAFAALLSRWSGETDVAIGTPIAGRLHKDVEPLIGFFVNTLVLRSDLSGDPDFVTLLAQTKATALAAYAHQEIPFEMLVEELKPARSLAHTPLFQVAFGMDMPVAPIDLPGIAVSPIAPTRELAKFDLSLSAGASGDGLRLSWLYATALFDAATIARLADAFVRVLHAVVAAPLTTVGALPLLDDVAVDVLRDFGTGATSLAYRDAALPQQIAAQASRTPDAIAVRAGDDALTYDAFNRRANRLAHVLMTQGIGRGERVGIRLDRSTELMIALVAVMKTGAAYVMLDARQTPERLQSIVADAGVRIVLDETLVDADGAADTDPVVTIDGDDSAYVLYTSGSTGTPKGVEIRHAGLTDYCAFAREGYYADHVRGSLVATSAAFDLTVPSLYVPLLTGGCVDLLPADGELIELARRLDGDAPASLLRLTPSHVRGMLSLADDAPRNAAHVFVIGGEAFAVTLAKQLQAKFPQAHIYNHYGPTETVVGCAWYDVSANLATLDRTIPIGRPMSNTQLYVLDANGQVQPVGVAGELYIGGSGVAKGYVNRPELTAEKFVADPFVPGARVYRSGDRVRWLADGTLEFLGRVDDQVKLRGFRIELGDIESVLKRCTGVRDAVAAVRGEADDARLVAYVVGDADVERVKAHASEHLPVYMQPAAIVALDALPLTPNGKVDRRALPTPDWRTLSTRTYEAPATDAEREVAQIWQELLGVERVGRDDRFFELGGHSLLVIALIERLRRRGLHADVRGVFTAPALRDFAARIGSEAADAVPPNRIPPDATSITPDMLPLVALAQDAIDIIAATVPGGAANIQDIYPLAPLQEGVLFHHLLEDATGGDGYLSRLTATFESRARLDAFLTALQIVIDRHDILRSAVQWTGLPQPVQVVHRHAVLPVQVLAPSPGTPVLEQLHAATDPARTRLDLRQAPILAAHIAPDHDGGWLLAFLYHHVVCDHISLERIHAEVGAVLEGRGDALPPSLPYRNFIARTRAVSEREHADYFRAQLGDVDEPTAPFGLTDVQGEGVTVREAHVAFDDGAARAIRDAARRAVVTPAVLFHVAWAQVLAACAGRDDVVFGTVLSGRLQGTEGADEVVGMFINTLPIRLRLAGIGAADAVRDAYRALGELLAHEQAALALAQRSSGVAPSLPLFNALLNYRHTPHGDDAETPAAWQGIRVLRNEERTNYPLVMSVEDWGRGFGLTAQTIGDIDPLRLARWLETATLALVDALATAPARPVTGLAVVPADERALLLDAYNATQAPLPAEHFAHRWFERCARVTPDAVALVYGDATLSYAEVNRRANVVAHRLIALGVQPDDRVAVCVERSPSMVIGLLAVLKAGGAYVPVDPSYPVDRIAYMLDDSAPVALLTQAAVRARLPVVRASALTAIVLDDAAQHDAPAALMHDPQVAALTPKHLAYVIYTSGSTGRPKGALVPHDGLANYLDYAHRHYWRDGLRGALVATPFGFDATVTSLMTPWLAGAPAVLLPEETHACLAALSACCRDTAPWLFKLTPAHLDALSHMADAAPSATPHVFVVGGEQLTRRGLARFRERVAWQALVVNEYGPTETVVGCATYFSDASEHAGGDAVPIGRPLANMRLYLLDAARQPVPLGAAGELYIGGAQVGRGYLNRADLTTERFVRDPFAGETEATMYRTGDLARWRADGALEYLGRNDDQVKIRGYRIEPGEIEAKLAACEGVRDALVLARTDGGDKRLVAYVVPHDGAVLSALALREALAAELAEYMIPAAFVSLTELPLTPNGKVDRKALPAPDASLASGREYEPPVGDVETALAQAWQELLGVPRVGRNDHFFELGGHSLLVIGLIERLRREGYAVDVRAVFTTPVLAVLAERVGLADTAAAAPAAPPNLIPTGFGAALDDADTEEFQV